MHSLLQTLTDHDLGHLRILAEFWGFDPPEGQARQAAEVLSSSILEPAIVDEIVDGLSPPIREALGFLIDRGGRIPFADLVRNYGQLREMGAGRRDREKPWRQPISPVETLWYMGFFARAFADTPNGPQEFAFIPNDLLALMTLKTSKRPAAYGEVARVPKDVKLASSAAVDDATTLLAALRRRPSKTGSLPATRRRALGSFLLQPASLEMLLTFLVEEAFLTDPPLTPDPEKTKDFLEVASGAGLRRLLQAWIHSTTWNDLAETPNLASSTQSWPNNPLQSREASLKLFVGIPIGEWWDLNGFLEAVKKSDPAFQRPAGEFDSWYLQDDQEGTFLQGVEHWDAVEGAMLRFMISGPLHWLGAIDLGRQKPEGKVDCFRLTSVFRWATDPEVEIEFETESHRTQILQDGRIIVPQMSDRTLRYQIARFTEWEPSTDDNFHYRVTPSALQVSLEQGLQISHILAVLEKASGGPLPDRLQSAIERWGVGGIQARMERPLLLQLNNPSVLDELKSTRSTRRYLGEIIGPTSVIISERNWSKLQSASARMGLLIDPPPVDPDTLP